MQLFLLNSASPGTPGQCEKAHHGEIIITQRFLFDFFFFSISIFSRVALLSMVHLYSRWLVDARRSHQHGYGLGRWTYFRTFSENGKWISGKWCAVAQTRALGQHVASCSTTWVFHLFKFQDHYCNVRAVASMNVTSYKLVNKYILEMPSRTTYTLPSPPQTHLFVVAKLELTSAMWMRARRDFPKVTKPDKMMASLTRYFLPLHRLPRYPAIALFDVCRREKSLLCTFAIRFHRLKATVCAAAASSTWKPWRRQAKSVHFIQIALKLSLFSLPAFWSGACRVL